MYNIDKAAIIIEINSKVYQVDIETEEVVGFLHAYAFKNGQNLNIFKAPDDIIFPEKMEGK